MKRMTIGTKLMASAGVMLALTLLLSYSGLSTLNTFKKQFDEAVGSSLRKIQLANAMVIGNSEMISEQRGEILAGQRQGQVGVREVRKDVQAESANGAVLDRESTASADQLGS